MKKRPGFVSATGIVAAVVLLAGVAVWALASGDAMFSPGGLNAETRAATVGGATSAGGVMALGGVATHDQLRDDCSACHPAPLSSQTMADRCLACHKGIAGQIDAGKGLHGHLAGTRSSPICRGCHPEHHGPHGALTNLDVATFPHDATGFSLRSHRRTDGGAKSTCAGCHPGGYETFDQAVCTDCHAKIDAQFMSRHRAAYGEDCLACHDGTGRDGAGFDHSKTSFPLTGKHAKVACPDCHASAQSRSDLQQTPHDCYSCHAKDDKHDGAYGRQCEDCHKTSAWDDVTFEHSVFPLDHGSEERKATCQTCHPSGTDTYTCYGCHEHTTSNVLAQHEGRSLTELQDCVRCHPGGRQAQD